MAEAGVKRGLVNKAGCLASVRVTLRRVILKGRCVKKLWGEGGGGGVVTVMYVGIIGLSPSYRFPEM